MMDPTSIIPQLVSLPPYPPPRFVLLLLLPFPMPSWPPRSTFNPFGMDSPPLAYGTLPSSTREHTGQGSAPQRLSNIPHSASLSHLQPRPPNLNDLTFWGYHPVFGIVHPLSGVCSVCKAYTNHMMAAMNQNDPSLAKAIGARRESQDTFFMDGFGEGMRHERENNSELKKLQTLLDITANALEDCVAENDSLHRELDRLKQQVANLEEEPRRLRGSVTGQSDPTVNLSPHAPPSISGSLDTGSRNSSMGSSVELQRCMVEDINYISSRPPVANTEPCDANTSHAMVSLNDGCTTHSAGQPTSTYASVASVHVSKNLTSHNISPRFNPSSPNLAPRNQHERQCVKYPKTMKELKDLMELAHEQTAEGAAALSIVKNVCSRAHSTPRDSKTFMQRWVLMNWKNPYASTSTPTTPVEVKANPRIDDPVEVWYEYLCTHPHSWPKGVRKDALGRPVMSDLAANRAVARMRPTESAAMRNDYISHVTDIFAIPGMYKQLLEKNNFTIASEVTYRTFVGVITADTIAQHFADSGFTPEDATNKFEPWAKHYKEC